MKHLHIDIETYSSVDLKKSGVYKYAASIDFEIMCVAYSYGSTVHVCDWQDLPSDVMRDLQDDKVQKFAHNAAFERVCLTAMGLNVGYNWTCTAILAGYNGLPMALKDVSAALNLQDKGKSSTGSALIRYFCVPVKATKVNGGRVRNLPHHDLSKWIEFKEYCRQDVVAEMEIHRILEKSPLPIAEQRMYEIDQRINETGVQVDIDFVNSVLYLNEIDRESMTLRAKELTGLSNPNSLPQLKKWIGDRTGEQITSLTKDTLDALNFDDVQVMELLSLRKKMSKTSVKKYDAMINCAMDDGRARGLFQYYGATRTGRWAGRLIQLQNLPRNYLKDLDAAREIVKSRDYELLTMLFDDVQDVLSQLIRTAFIFSGDATHLTTSDYSAIEARVLAWLAGEDWRMEVFRSKEKKDIYVESASQMFKKAIEDVDSQDRQKGKIAELALGYQGSKGALAKMDTQKLLSPQETENIVTAWRAANPNIVAFWKTLNDAATASVKFKKTVEVERFTFKTNETRMTIMLPSGRKLCYWKARIAKNKWGHDSVQYLGIDTETKKWSWVDTYGGKIAENLTQAVARDFMSEALVRVHEQGHKIVMHVHDEIVTENGKAEELERIMKVLPDWAEDFPIDAKGEEIKYFQK